MVLFVLVMALAYSPVEAGKKHHIVIHGWHGDLVVDKDHVVIKDHHHHHCDHWERRRR